MAEGKGSPLLVRWSPPLALAGPVDDVVDTLEAHLRRKMKLVDQQLLSELFKTHPRTFRRSGSASPSPSGSEEDDDDFLPRGILRHRKYRRSVMPSASTFTAKPKRQSKIVHFADSVGQSLESVHYVIHNELPPIVPASAFDHLKKEKLCIHRHLVPMFPEPCSETEIMERVHRDGISLDKLNLIDTSINGIIRVLNVAYEKIVTVRYTLNEWKTHADIESNYVGDDSSSNSSVDKFSFSIFIPVSEFLPGQKLHFALRMQSAGREFWDNNDTKNYTLVCEAKQVPVTQNQSWLHFM